MRFVGDTITFKRLFNAHNIFGRYEDKDGIPLPADASNAAKQQANYVRIIKSINIANQAHKAFLLQMIMTTLFKGTLVVVEWVGPVPQEGDGVHVFKKELESIKQAIPKV